jgi:uroporphyrinogen decarboxylase
MRQAGRALPEYRALKETHSFLEMVRTPDLAVEVTLQPVRRFGFDAAILFSDILVVCEALGQPYHFRDTGGIAMDFTLRESADVDRLEVEGVVERLSYATDALRILRRELGQKTALIGFAGSPWTLANFMVEGGGSKDYSEARELFHRDRPLFNKLMEKLTVAVSRFLQAQIDAGADAVQIFDSLGGVLADNIFEAASAVWMRRIIAELRGRVPVIVFSKGTNGQWPVLSNTGANILGVDWTVRLADVRKGLPANVGVQGNLDPALLCTTPDAAATETARILHDMRDRPGHIFNLGHGVPPSAKLECIESVVKTVRNFA